MKKIFLFLFLLSSTLFSQDLQFQGRMHILSDGCDSTSMVKRIRLLTHGYVNKNISFRVQYSPVNQQLYDSWVGFHYLPKTEIRIGRSWLPAVGEATSAPFFIDNINYSPGASVFQPRDEGVFILGEISSDLSYNLAIINGGGFETDENTKKDFFASIKFKISGINLFIGGYAGQSGPDSLLTRKDRSIFQVDKNFGTIATIKLAKTKADDNQISTDYFWSRLIFHTSFFKSEKIDFILEKGFSRNTQDKEKYYLLGLNYYFSEWNRLMVNYLKKPDDYSFSVQTQIIFKN
jgi:hypothetical protein